MLNKSKEQLFVTYLKGLKVDNPEKILEEIRGEGKHFELRDAKGITPAHIACFLGFEDIANHIVTNRKDLINLPDNQGDTPLHWACLGRRHEVIKLLVENGAEIDAVAVAGIKKIKPLFRLLATDNSEKDFESMKLILDKSKDGAGLARQALEYCGINHAYPTQPTEEVKFLNKYIELKSTQKEGNWVNTVNQSKAPTPGIKTQEFTK